MGQFPPSPPLGGLSPRPGRRIYDLLRAQMADGTLPPGSPVPSTRALAVEFGISRTTVTAAYEQLAAEGFIVTSAGRRARVAQALPVRAKSAPRPRPRARRAPILSDFGRRLARADAPVPMPQPAGAIDFRYGALAAHDYPSIAWRRQYLAELYRRPAALYYIEPQGEAALQHAVQRYLARARGVVCDADQIVVVNGSQQAIDLCARLLLNADDAFLFEEPGYRMARLCFEATGAKRLCAPVDAQGLVTEGLPDDGRVRLVYVTPSHQFPLGGVLPHGRRQQLLQWARRHRAWIVEDDYDGEFRYGQRPIDALQSLDADGRVLYVGTFSKVLSPQLRLGYLVLPHDLVAVFRQAKRVSDRHAPALDQRVLATLIDNGTYERHVRRLRRENERRRNALADAVARHLPADTELAGAAAGLHVVLWLPWLPSTAEASLTAAARDAGVGIYPVSPLYARPRSPDRHRAAGLVLGYASLSVDRIEAGIGRLGTILARFRAAHAQVG